MPDPAFDESLLRNLTSADQRKKEDAFRQLLKYAQAVAATRNRAHEESIAQSAVVYVLEQISSREVEFKTPAQLLAYLRKVASGKAIRNVRKDRRLVRAEENLDLTVMRPASPAPSVGGGRSQTTDRVRSVISAWMHRLPSELRAQATTHAADLLGAAPVARHAHILQEIETDALALGSTLERALALLPSPLRTKALSHIRNLDFPRLKAAIPRLERILAAAASLSDRDRAVVQMREIGIDARQVADQLNLTDANVRVIHHRFRTRLDESAER